MKIAIVSGTFFSSMEFKFKSIAICNKLIENKISWMFIFNKTNIK